MWLKAVPLKVNIFIWRLFLNRLSTKDNLLRRGVIDATQLPCATFSGESEDHIHLFFRCDVYGRLWPLVMKWLGFEEALIGDTISHAHQFRDLGGFSKNSRCAFITIWTSVLFIIWKDRNKRIFHNMFDTLEILTEKVKLQTYWWFKSYYILFDFDYPVWRHNPLSCLKAIV